MYICAICFQFSLWDSLNIGLIIIYTWHTFNSLYEILFTSLRRWRWNHNTLSILFMRFEQIYPSELQFHLTFNSLYEILFIMTQLLLFILLTFNSLYEILFCFFNFLCCYIVFQFSLWDSPQLIPASYSQTVLSILFMRFATEAARNYADKIAFQFSLWDSLPFPNSLLV